MYHIIKSLQLLNSNKSLQNKLFAENEKEIFKKNDNKTTKKLLIYGLIEMIPILIGTIFHLTIDRLLIKYDYIILGIIGTAILIFIFRQKIPEIPIQYRESNDKKPYRQIITGANSKS